MSVQHRFAQRGFTMQRVPPEEYGQALIDWMASRGLNRLELQTGRRRGFGILVRNHPELCDEFAAQFTQRLAKLVAYGRQAGVRVVPAFLHYDANVKLIQVHPEWRVQGHVFHPTGTDLARGACCFRHPGVIELHHQMVHDLVEAVQPDEVQFWLTENRLRCECPTCTAAVGRDPFDLTEDYFLQQARLCHQSVVSARTMHPSLEISLWTTQGSRPHNQPLIRALPQEVLWFYYDGERLGNYNLRRRRVIPPEIRQLRREGFRLGVQLDWASCGEFLTTPGTIREIALEAAEAELEAVVGWVNEYPLNQEAACGGAHPVLAYAARICNQPSDDDGQSLAHTMEQAALQAGHSPTVAHAAGEAWLTLDHSGRTIRLADSYSYYWHGTNLPGAICLRIIHRTPVDEIDQRWIDDVWDKTLPELDTAIGAVDRQVQALSALEDATGYLASLRTQMEMVSQWGRVCRECLWAAIIYHRMGSWDTWHGPWRDDRTELLATLNRALQALERCEQLLHTGTKLVGDRYRPSQRLPVLKKQLQQAIEAAEDGAQPTALPEQDVYPYSAPH